MGLPLAGIRVIEATNWVAAPSAAVVMADMGADVVKVEPLGGDAMRNMIRPPRVPDGQPKIDSAFTVDNRGKRSIALALDTQEGADVARRLIADADVFVCNLLPHRQAKFGLDPETLHALNPTLVHATLTGYGIGGPDERRPGYDVTAFFGRGSITDFTTDPGMVAPHPGTGQGDHTTGLALAVAILAALRLVDQTGKGQVVDTSLFATAAWTMASDLSAPLVDGGAPTKRGRFDKIVPLTNRFLTSDDRWLIVNMPEERYWPMFCAAVGLDHLVEDERFATLRSRFKNMRPLIEIIDKAMVTKSLAEWGPIFDDAGLIWGPASTVAELAADPQAEAVGMFPDVPHAGGAHRTVAIPVNIAGADIGPQGPAPAIGAHTREVLAESGYSAEEIDALIADGSVGTGQTQEER